MAVARAEEYAPEHLELHVADPDALVPRIRNAGSVFVGCSSVVGDYAAGATHVLPTGGLARSTGGLGVEAFLKPVQVVTATPEGAPARGRGHRAAGPCRRAPAARGGRGMSAARELAQPVGPGYAPYVWSAAVDEVAEQHGVPREAVLKFDQNTPALPGVPQVALAQSMARLNEYPDGHLPRAS